METGNLFSEFEVGDAVILINAKFPRPIYGRIHEKREDDLTVACHSGAYVTRFVVVRRNGRGTILEKQDKMGRAALVVRLTARLHRLYKKKQEV